MDTAVILGLIVAAAVPTIGAAVSYGGTKSTARHLEKAIGELRTSIKNTLERVGGIEKDVAVLLDRHEERHRRKSYVGVVQGQVSDAEEST